MSCGGRASARDACRNEQGKYGHLEECVEDNVGAQIDEAQDDGHDRLQGQRPDRHAEGLVDSAEAVVERAVR